MIYTIKDTDKYFWSFGDNLDQPESERAWAEISLPSAARAMEVQGYNKENSIFEFLLYVKAVHNFKIVCDGEEREATPEDIVNLPGLSELYLELYNRYKKYISIDKKKLKSASGSTSKDSEK